MRLELLGVVGVEIAEIGDCPDTARSREHGCGCPIAPVLREHHADRKFDDDRVDILAIERVDACEQNLGGIRTDYTVEPDQIEEEGILTRPAEHLDVALSRNYRRIVSHPRGPLGGEPFDHDVVRENRPIGLASWLRRRAVGPIAEWAEHEVDFGGWPRIAAGREVEAIKRILLKVVAGPEQRIRDRLRAERHDEVRARTVR